MEEIKVLDNNLIDKIAAGEVIERPSSVVKELVENSIDAGATSITVEIKDGGTTFIKISDNGSGIKKEFIKTAFLRHATSKISGFDDLENILTLGFRGEALSSIASVAQVELITKTKDDTFGTKLQIDGGRVIREEQIGANIGTIFVIKNLFFNIPVRRKFLKKVATESSYISEIINKIVLANPYIEFKYINNNSVVLQTSGNGDISESIFYVYGKDISKKMLPIDANLNGYSICGMLGLPEISRGNRNYENTFLMGRHIKSDIIQKSVEEAYSGKTMIGKFPVFVLNIKVPPATVDVNVHPAKLEVRFIDEDFIYKFIRDEVLKVLTESNLIPNIELSTAIKSFSEITDNKPFNTDIQNEIANIILGEKETILKDKNFENRKDVYELLKEDENYKKDLQDIAYSQKPTDNTINVSEVSYKNPELHKTDDKNIEVKKNLYKNQQNVIIKSEELNKYKFNDTIRQDKKSLFSNYKIIGQIFNTYWIIEQGNSIYMIDQHSAHERYIYEEILKKFKDGTVESQKLLEPIPLNVSEKEMVTIEDNKDLLIKFGFDVERLGRLTYAIISLPYIFKNPVSSSIFMEIIDVISDKNLDSIFDMKLEKIVSMSCRSAVKANDKLSVSEVYDLIGGILSLENPFTCPHGRPTIIEITKYEVEKMFGRIQH